MFKHFILKSNLKIQNVLFISIKKHNYCFFLGGEASTTFCIGVTFCTAFLRMLLLLLLRGGLNLFSFFEMGDDSMLGSFEKTEFV